jgi:hypothetical protein
MLLAMLGDGRLHLSGIARLAPHLTPENRDEVLRRAAHRSKRQIEELVSSLSPRPDAVALIRKLPERHLPARSTPKMMPTPASAATPTVTMIPTRTDGVVSVVQLVPERVASPARHASIEPLSPARYKVQFTASAGLREKLERLQALMRSSVPDGDLAAIVEAAVMEKLQRLEEALRARARR